MKPNIVMIVIDGLRPKDLSLYGYPKETDKNIKKIASESVVFNQNFSASNASDVSMTSIFSGQYPKTSGFIHQMPRTEKEEIEKLKKNKFWLPLYLQKKSYSTISATPQYMWFKKGFDYSKEKVAEGKGKLLNIPIIKKILLRLPNWMYRLGKRLVKIRASPLFYSSKQIIDLSISKIKETKKPFFLFMHLVDTHCPYAGVRSRKIKGKNTIDGILKNINYSSQKEYIKKRFFDSSTNSLEQIKGKLDDSIISVDKEVGRLSDFLKRKNLWKNTIFIILSDHGDTFGENKNYFCRGGLYDSTVHVPLIMHLPGIKPKKINELTSSIDIAPTIVDALKDTKIRIDGKSLIPLMKKQENFRKEIILSDGFCKSRTGIRTKTKKRIISEDGKCYLCGAQHGEIREEYDLKKDPEEIHNIYSK